MAADPRHTTLTAIERDSEDQATPVEAYFMISGGRYVLGSGNKAGEAAAFLKDVGAGKFVLDSDPAEEDRALYLTGSNRVIA